MAEATSMKDILEGSTPDGQPIEREASATQAAPQAETPTPSAEPSTEAAPVERATSRRKAFQQKERDTREAAEGRVRDPETGQYVAKPAEQEVKPEAQTEAKPEVKQETAPQQPAKEQAKQEFTEKERAFLAAAQEERRKRQALENQLRELQAKPAEEKKTFWDDPEAALQHFQQQTAAAITKTRLDTAEAIARTKYKDFDENVAEFSELLQNVPGLRDQLLQASDPAEFAYRTGQRQKELKSIGNIEEYRAKVERETRAKLEAEFAAKDAERRKLAESLPTSLSDVRGSGSGGRVVFAGPPALDDILSGR